MQCLSHATTPQVLRGLPCPPPGDFPNPGIKPMSPMSLAFQVDSLPIEPMEKSYIYTHN